MLSSQQMRDAAELSSRFKPGTDEYQRAMIYTGAFAIRAHDILKMATTARLKELAIHTAHELHLAKLRNLLEPIIPDTGPMPELPHVSDDTILSLFSEWLLLVGGVGMILSAWDTVGPIGWVSTKKAEPAVIPNAIKNARALYAHVVPNEG